MATVDIETLLKSPIDAVIPFLKQTESKDVLSVNLGRDGKAEITALVLKVIGAVSRGSKQEKASLFATIYRTITNK